jgi:hypothetical protein
VIIDAALTILLFMLATTPGFFEVTNKAFDSWNKQVEKGYDLQR